MRDKIIEDLAYEWRKAEDYFIEYESDSEKLRVLDEQKKLKLTPEEEKELYAILESMGV
jgi:hypothetical protein